MLYFGFISLFVRAKTFLLLSKNTSMIFPIVQWWFIMPMNDPFLTDTAGKRIHRTIAGYDVVLCSIEQACSRDVGDSFDTKFLWSAS